MRKTLFVISVIGVQASLACSASQDPGTPVAATDEALMADAPLRAQVLSLVNAARAAGATCGAEKLPAVPPLKENSALVRAAANHSADMCARNYFAHDTPNGKTPFDRVKEAGYGYTTAGENIAAGQGDAASVVAEWLSSPGHCKNLMSADYTEVGTGHHKCTDEYGHYWTQNYGRPKASR